MKMRKRDLTVTVAGVKFPNPVIAASGVYGYGEYYTDLYPLSLMGGVSCKGMTLNKKSGNVPPRVAETPAGMLNSVGLQNPGVDAFIKDELPFLREYDTIVIANISGNTADEYAQMTEKLSGAKIDIIEVNVSCPNVKAGGMAFGTSTEGVAEVTKAVMNKTTVPVMVKLSPNVTDIASIAKAAEDSGADAISLINTLLGMRIDVMTRKPILNNNVGGLSGPAVFPVALRMVWQVASAVKVPILGMGGIQTGKDAAEMMLAGANIVAVGTACFDDPYAPVRIIKELKEYMAANSIKDLTELTGKVEIN